MNSITELTSIDDYEFFALCPIGWVSFVGTYSSSGYEECSYCDVYGADNYSLLCFKKPPKGSFSKHNFIASNADKTFNIQEAPYESVMDVISGERLYPYSFYTYCDSVQIINNSPVSSTKDAVHNTGGKEMTRCDNESWGPLTFYDVSSGYDLVRLRVVLSVGGTAHVIRIDTNNTEIRNKNSQAANCSGKSLRGLFKTIKEWSQVALEPFGNTENPALKAEAFLQGLAIPEEIIEEVLEDCPNMRVAQFLTGMIVPIEDFEENYSVPNSLQLHLKSIYRYRTLAALQQNHPMGSLLDVSSSLVNDQKQKIESVILKFLLENSINPLSVASINYNAIMGSIDNNKSTINEFKFFEVCEAFNGYK